MTTTIPIKGLSEIANAWAAFQTHVDLRPIRNEADYERISALADQLIEAIGDRDQHPLYDLLQLMLQAMERWEDDNIYIPKAEPREVLRHLLEANHLKQKDLGDIASQTVISDILAGRRDISKRLAKALADKFHVDIGAFI